MVDPYFQVSTGSATSAQLDEFENYWDANYDSIPRALAMMLPAQRQRTPGAVVWNGRSAECFHRRDLAITR